MQLFNVYFKVIRRYLPVMMIYVVIFFALAVMLSVMVGGQTERIFSPTKTNIAFIDKDGTPLTAGLKSYLSKNARVVPLPDTTQSLQDALFYGEVDYILRVPRGFTQNFLSAETSAETSAGARNVKLEKTTASGSTSSVNMDFLIGKYMNTASLFEKTLPGTSQQQLVAYIDGTLGQKADVRMNSYGRPDGTTSVSYYFRYFAYSVAAVMILGVGQAMLSFNEAEVRKRMLCSPLKTMQMNLQLLLGNLTFALATWALLTAAGAALYRTAFLNGHPLLLGLNALALTLAWLSISYLLSIVIHSRNAQSAAANVLALGTCFIGGVFVPQELLGKSVLLIGSFTPTFWYSRAVDLINNLSANAANGGAGALWPVYQCVLIQLGFAAAFIAVSLVVAKQKRTSAA